jgi:hypothetical protein
LLKIQKTLVLWRETCHNIWEDKRSIIDKNKARGNGSI